MLHFESFPWLRPALFYFINRLAESYGDYSGSYGFFLLRPKFWSFLFTPQKCPLSILFMPEQQSSATNQEHMKLKTINSEREINRRKENIRNKAIK